MTEVVEVDVPGPRGAPGAPGAASTVPGPQGDQGDPGVDGVDGVDGQDGADGGPGLLGPQGDPGVDGVDGADGQDGDQGLPGTDGVDGEQGDPGVDGENGADGGQGIQGIQGIQGVKGDQGDQGIQGVPGAGGGEGGEPGPQGDQGIQGVPGEQGIQGEQGEVGPVSTVPGPQGEPGVDGVDGEDGADGAPGLDGADGADGEPGPQGEPGADGGGGGAGGMAYHEAWRGDLDYDVDDVVTHDGGLFIAIEPVEAGTLAPPTYIGYSLAKYPNPGLTLALPVDAQEGDLVYVVSAGYTATYDPYPEGTTPLVAYQAENGNAHLQVSTLRVAEGQTTVVLPPATFGGNVALYVFRGADIFVGDPNIGQGLTTGAIEGPAGSQVFGAASSTGTSMTSSWTNPDYVYDNTVSGFVLAVGHAALDTYVPFSYPPPGGASEGFKIHFEVVVSGVGSFPEDSFDRIATVDPSSGPQGEAGPQGEPGEQGIQGEPGADGGGGGGADPDAVHYESAWDAHLAYTENDVVTHEGGLYIATEDIDAVVYSVDAASLPDGAFAVSGWTPRAGVGTFDVEDGVISPIDGNAWYGFDLGAGAEAGGTYRMTLAAGTSGGYNLRIGTDETTGYGVVNVSVSYGAWSLLRGNGEAYSNLDAGGAITPGSVWDIEIVIEGDSATLRAKLHANEDWLPGSATITAVVLTNTDVSVFLRGDATATTGGYPENLRSFEYQPAGSIPTGFEQIAFPVPDVEAAPDATALHYKSAWDAEAEYLANDLVTAGGGAFVALLPHYGVDPTETTDPAEVGSSPYVNGNQIGNLVASKFTTNKLIVLTAIEVYLNSGGSDGGTVGICEPFTGYTDPTTIQWLCESPFIVEGSPEGWYTLELFEPLVLPAGDYQIASDNGQSSISWTFPSAPTGVVSSVSTAWYGAHYETEISDKPMAFRLVGTVPSWEALVEPPVAGPEPMHFLGTYDGRSLVANEVVSYDDGLYIATGPVVAADVPPPTYVGAVSEEYSEGDFTIALPSGIEAGDLAFITQTSWGIPADHAAPMAEGAVEVVKYDADVGTYDTTVRVSALELTDGQTEIVLGQPLQTTGSAGGVMHVQVFRGARVTTIHNAGGGTITEALELSAGGTVICSASYCATNSGQFLTAPDLDDQHTAFSPATNFMGTVGWTDDYSPFTWAKGAEYDQPFQERRTEVVVGGGVAVLDTDAAVMRIGTI